MEDLWPKDLTSDVPKIRTPVSILKEQGSLLGNKTGNIIEGLVRKVRTQDEDPDVLTYRFRLKSAPLDYVYDLFMVSYEITLYPVRLWIDDDHMIEELGLSPRKPFVEAGDEETFKSLVKKVLSTKRVKAIVSAILAQSEEGRS